MPGTQHPDIDGSVILTVSGRYVNPLDLKVEDIVIEDVAHALSNQCRYTGHTRGFYSVAQHSVLVAKRLRKLGESEEVQRVGLLHDATEAYLQDVARPLKVDPYFGKAYRGAEGRAERVVAEAFGLPFPWPPVVKQVDTEILAQERRELMPPNGRWKILDGVEEPTGAIRCWTPFYAHQRFIDLYKELT